MSRTISIALMLVLAAPLFAQRGGGGFGRGGGFSGRGVGGVFRGGGFGPGGGGIRGGGFSPGGGGIRGGGFPGGGGGVFRGGGGFHGGGVYRGGGGFYRGGIGFRGGYYGGGFGYRSYPRYGGWGYGGWSYPAFIGGFGIGFGYGFGGWSDYYGPSYYYPPPVVYSQPSPPVVIVNESRPGYEYTDYRERPAEAAPAREYQPTIYSIAFRDHRIVQALAYWVKDGRLHYVTRDHELREAPLEEIDRRFSEQINRDKRVEFRLPEQ